MATYSKNGKNLRLLKDVPRLGPKIEAATNMLKDIAALVSQIFLL